MSRRPGDWTCDCGELKFASKTRCWKCGKVKPSTLGASSSSADPYPCRSGDWKCPRCGDNQFARNTECRKCKTPRPATSAATATAPKQSHPGEWICSNCGDLQFKDRLQCRQCNRSKPCPDDTPDEKLCMMCATNVRNAGFFHGDDVHTVCCMECAQKVYDKTKMCPVCRKIIDRVIKSFV